MPCHVILGMTKHEIRNPQPRPLPSPLRLCRAIGRFDRVAPPLRTALDYTRPMTSPPRQPWGRRMQGRNKLSGEELDDDPATFKSLANARLPPYREALESTTQHWRHLGTWHRSVRMHGRGHQPVRLSLRELRKWPGLMTCRSTNQCCPALLRGFQS